MDIDVFEGTEELVVFLDMPLPTPFNCSAFSVIIRNCGAYEAETRLMCHERHKVDSAEESNAPFFRDGARG